MLVILLVSIFSGVAKAQTTELTDRKNIVFARNLVDWQLNPVDSLQFDIYYPTGATSNKKYPVYFSLHGGSFTTATKQSVSEFSDGFADYGYVIIAPDYRTGYNQGTGDCGTVPKDDSTNLQGAIYRAMQDVNACMRYIANHADEYNIDTSKIFVGGASAGGTLALNMSYVTDSLAAIHYPGIVAQWGKLQNVGNTEPYNYKIKGICAMWGGMPYWDSLVNKKSGIPTIFFKGQRDTNLPNGTGYYLGCTNSIKVRAGRGIYDQMTAQNIPAVFHFQLNAGHSAYDNDFCRENTACFFNGLSSNAGYTGYYELYDTSCR